MVAPEGFAPQLADGGALPNGMKVTPDNSTPIFAESYGTRLTAFDIAADGSLSSWRMWADRVGASPTAFASRPKTPSGTGTSPSSVTLRRSINSARNTSLASQRPSALTVQ